VEVQGVQQFHGGVRRVHGDIARIESCWVHRVAHVENEMSRLYKDESATSEERAGHRTRRGDAIMAMMNVVARLIAHVHIILSLPCGEQKRHNPINVKFWEVIADNLSKAGWSWDCVATVDPNGKTIFVADAHRDNGKRFIVTADEKLRAFLELQRVTRESFRSPNAE
jgi:hypothetical protein